MARIVNLTTNSIVVSDLLTSSITQYQDGVKSWVLGPSATGVIPNLQACNSMQIKALLDAVPPVITINTAVEPSDIVGMAGV